MRTFDQFMNLKTMEPRLLEAARLMMELDINPEEYLQVLNENPSWNAATDSFAGAADSAARAGMQGLQGMGQAMTGAAHGAWNVGSRAANAVANSGMGQGIRGWWQDFNSADRKLEKAASLIQKAVSDPVLNAGDDKTMLNQIIADLTAIAGRAKTARKSPTPGPTPTPGPAPTP